MHLVHSIHKTLSAHCSVHKQFAENAPNGASGTQYTSYMHCALHRACAAYAVSELTGAG